MGTEDIFVHITLLFLGNPLETFSADELLSQKAQFYDSWPILPHYFQILLFMVPPSTWGYTGFTTASSKPCITTLRNYNSVDANDFVKFIFFILNEDKFSFSSACLQTLFGKAGFGSSWVPCFPWGSLQVEPAFTKTSELPDRARVWNAVGTLAPGPRRGRAETRAALAHTVTWVCAALIASWLQTQEQLVSLDLSSEHGRLFLQKALRCNSFNYFWVS